MLTMPIIQASSAFYDRIRSQKEDRIQTRFSCFRSQKGELILEFPREKSRNGELILEILGIRSRIWDRIIVRTRIDNNTIIWNSVNRMTREAKAMNMK